MTRGNQRECARLKNLKEKNAGKKSSEQDGNKGTSLSSRKQRDADVMRDKQLKAVAKKEEDAKKAAAK